MRPSDAGRLLLLAAIWGSSYLLIKLGLRSFNPFQVVSVRLFVGALLLLLVLRTRGRRLPRGLWGPLLFMAAVSNVIPFLLITWGEEHISSSLASILNSTTPLFTAVIAGVFLSERLTPIRSSGILLGFAGVGVIVGVGGAGGSLLGELAVVLASLSYGVGFVFARSRLTGGDHSHLGLSAAQLIVAGVLSLPPTLWSSRAGLPEVEAVAVAALLLLGAVGTGAAYLLYYRLVADVGPTTASFVTYLIPVIGVALGWVALDERLGWNVAAGTVLVVAGIALAERGAARPVRRAEDPSGSSSPSREVGYAEETSRGPGAGRP